MVVVMLMLGDCLIEFKKIKSKSIDLVCIDPPYNIKKAEWDNWKTLESYVEFMGKVFIECQRVLKDNGSFYFFHNNFLTIVELQSWLNKNSKFIFKQLIIWNKKFKGYWHQLNSIVSGPVRNYSKQAEYILFYTFQDEKPLTYSDLSVSKETREYFHEERQKVNHFNYKQINSILGFKTSGGGYASDVLNPYKKNWKFPEKVIYEKFQKLGICFKNYEELHNWKEDKYTFNNQKTSHSVWNYEIAKIQGHITPKPVELMMNIIKHSSNEKDTVLDCFMGSGSTGVAAKALNRKFIGIEKNEKYFEIAKERMSTK